MAAAERERIEADARAREAEARARAAEAEARRAEMDAQSAGAIPLGMGYPYGGIYGGPFVGGAFDLVPFAVAAPPPPPAVIVVTVPEPRRDRDRPTAAPPVVRAGAVRAISPGTPKHQP